MWTKEARINGGKAASKVIRDRNLSKYLESPHCCLQCGKIIIPKGNEHLWAMRAKKFCNRSCSAKYRYNLGNYGFGNYNKTRPPRKSPPRNKSGKSKGELSDIYLSRTKKDIFDSCSSWTSARARITHVARYMFKRSGREYKCFVCGYTNHVDISHIKPIRLFSDDAKLSEMNSPDNLIALCPNHHWEFDHSLLEIAGFGVEPN